MANKGLEGNYYIPDQIKQKLQSDMDSGKGGKNRRRIIGYLNDGHITDREIAKLLYDYKQNQLGAGPELKVIEKLIKWVQREVGGKAEHIYRTKKSQTEIDPERSTGNKHKKTHFKWGDDTKPINFHNLVSIPKPEKMFEQGKPQTAIISIEIPIAYMDKKYYIQDVPYPFEERGRVYIKKGAAGNKSISSKSVKVLHILDYDQTEQIQTLLNQERSNRELISESLETINPNMKTVRDFKEILSLANPNGFVVVEDKNDNMKGHFITMPSNLNVDTYGYYDSNGNDIFQGKKTGDVVGLPFYEPIGFDNIIKGKGGDQFNGRTVKMMKQYKHIFSISDFLGNLQKFPDENPIVLFNGMSVSDMRLNGKQTIYGYDVYGQPVYFDAQPNDVVILTPGDQLEHKFKGGR